MAHRDRCEAVTVRGARCRKPSFSLYTVCFQPYEMRDVCRMHAIRLRTGQRVAFVPRRALPPTEETR